MRRRNRSHPFAALLAAVLLAAGGGVAAATDAPPQAPAESVPAPLPSLCIDPGAVSLSGISSGGYMAQQFHVAHSTEVMGVAVFAGGPYLCAGSDYPLSMWRGMSVCSDFLPFPFQGPPDLQRSMQATREAAARGEIDAPEGMRGDAVLLFSGTRDTAVPQPVMDVLDGYYQAFTPAARISYRNDVPAAHAMITTDFGNACATSKSPFLNDCDFDLAGAALQRIYGELAPPAPLAAEPQAFDQRPFFHGRRASLADTGYLYVPAACREGAPCRLHVALHGCLQNAETIGDAFYRHAGYNGWAEANRIVVLYPQTTALTWGFGPLTVPWPNPNGCWDWWGFTGGNFATRDGRQIRALQAMIEQLQGGHDTAPRCAGSR